MNERCIFAFSRSGPRSEISGPQKVFRNLRLGLNQIGWELVEGFDPPQGANIWIHDDWTALYDRSRFRGKIVIGPNLAVLPKQLPGSLRRGGILYIQPSIWAAQMWCQCGFDASSLVVWPVGIDTERFVARDPTRARRVLLYFKERYDFELRYAEHMLRRQGIEYRLLRYGAYKESEFVKALAETSWCMWIGRHESQGIALQEVLASDVPILICDATFLFHAHPQPHGFPLNLAYLPTESAPYFDRSCGVQVQQWSKLNDAVAAMNVSWRNFSPRSYIQSELGLEKQAREFVDIFGAQEHINGMPDAPIAAWRPSLPARFKEFHRRARAKVSYWQRGLAS